jgi:F-type H+-transporting ATPase subunit b
MSELFAAFGVDWKLLLIQAVNFGLLLAALSYFLYRPLMRIIDERRETVAAGVRKAEEADRKLSDAAREKDTMIGNAAREAEGIVANARTRADEKGSEIVRAAEARAAAELNDARARAEEARNAAMRESQQEIARAALLAAEKILREKTI